MSAHTLANAAQRGFSGSAAYDQHRPSYPAESIENLLKELKITGFQGAKVLDLAAGTGKFTELLAQRPEKFDIVAVEPHDDMRKTLAEKKLSGVETMKGFAESIAGVETGWADAVVVAQAFHWFAKVDVLKEINRVIAPGGNLGLIWNIDDYNCPKNYEATTAYEAKLLEHTWTLQDDAKRFRDMEWMSVFDEQLKSTPFSIQSADPLFSLPLGEHVESWEVWLTAEGVWSRYYTLSPIANLRGEQLEQFKKHVFDILAEAPKNEKGEIAMHGRTLSYWTTAVPSFPIQKD